MCMDWLNINGVFTFVMFKLHILNDFIVRFSLKSTEQGLLIFCNLVVILIFEICTFVVYSS